jgi:hypothetical protein
MYGNERDDRLECGDIVRRECAGRAGIVGTGDFKGDGKSDIVWGDGSGNVATWEINGTTILNQATSFVANVAGNWSIQDPERN